ncbi:deoxynucleoside kinase [Flavobacteriales bacterium]|nr:deoxynucleoside kinase [Flavobacteriales bacterium]
MRLNNFTVIEGNIGSGKTTLCKKISKDFNANLILEEFEENLFLKDFLIDQKINPLGVELQFLIDRFHQLKKPFNNNNPTVADYFIEKSLIFSKNNLSEIEKNLFDSYYSVLFEKITKPNLLVYLSVEPDRLIENITKRGREIEQELTKEYLESIHNSYLNYLNNKKDKKVLIIDISDIDFVQNESDYINLKNIITSDHKIGVTQMKI